jgi:hypothetical protein
MKVLASVTIQQIAESTGLSLRSIRRRLGDCGFRLIETKAGGKARKEYALADLPDEWRRLFLSPHVVTEPQADYLGLGSASDTWAKASEHKRAVATRRLNAINAHVHHTSVGHTAGEAYELVRQEFDVPRRTLLEWIKDAAKWERVEDQLAALLPKQRNPNPKRHPIHPDAKNALITRYKTQTGQEFSECYYQWCEDDFPKHSEWGTPPSLSTARRRIERTLPATWKLFNRQGPKAFTRAFPSLRRDHGSVGGSLAWVNADGHTPDVFVSIPSRYPNEKPWKGRVSIVVVQDVYSGFILGWDISRDEDKHSANRAFGRVLRDWGVFDKLTVDNGHAFANTDMTGGLSNRKRFKFHPGEFEGWLVSMGIDVNFARVAHGQSKPIERFFRDFEKVVGKSLDGAYTGRSPLHKPENYDERAIPIEEFTRLVERGIERINGRPTRAGVCNGRIRKDVFLESLKAREERGEIRRPTEAQIRWMLLPAERKTVRANSTIQLFGNEYTHDKLVELRGHKVNVKYDPDKLHGGLWVFESGKLDPICFAECNAPVGYGDVEAAASAAKIERRRLRAARDESRELGTLKRRELVERGEHTPAVKPRRERSNVVAGDFNAAHRPPRERLPDGITQAQVEEMKQRLLRGSGRATG